MIVYATHAGGRYLQVADSLKEQPEGKRGIYINLTNKCNCACTFCLRNMKEMAEQSSLWLKEEPSVPEVKSLLDELPWDMVSEIVFCGFGEPTCRIDAVVELLKYVKDTHPEVKTRLNTNGLSDLMYGRSTAGDFAGGILDTVSISLNASNKERYLELTRAKYGIESFDAMLKFAVDCKEYVPNVVMTVVEKVENQQEIDLCQKICDDRGLKLRVRIYEDS
ncbi:MAG: radical SAM protein [Anaerovibrio sp.]|uniref:Radical SAM protein n=2 Tax=Anaerovibrio lipolyticus TaxID=82374 RepID=A0A0B2K0N2_9FIRM|nr:MULTISPECIES: TatD family nuclease-associated radical SAM protein [Anaerovibrio]KHM52381.1 radical SAM protein [Anaerovibrio lipolyticus]MBO6246371.1 radical SAM protein [Anaerovibrio sp.]SHI90156.1 radical SAM protein, TatD family-associated [Anaerovibrio lipolyticus DSM 3074]